MDNEEVNTVHKNSWSVKLRLHNINIPLAFHLCQAFAFTFGLMWLFLCIYTEGFPQHFPPAVAFSITTWIGCHVNATLIHGQC